MSSTDQRDSLHPKGKTNDRIFILATALVKIIIHLIDVTTRMLHASAVTRPVTSLERVGPNQAIREITGKRIRSNHHRWSMKSQQTLIVYQTNIH